MSRQWLIFGALIVFPLIGLAKQGWLSTKIAGWLTPRLTPYWAILLGILTTGCKDILAHQSCQAALQDGIMTGTTVGIQPSRMCQFEHLGADCAANAYTPDADGQFGYSLDWCWGDGGLRFGYYWAGDADQYFGSASGRLS